MIWNWDPLLTIHFCGYWQKWHGNLIMNYACLIWIKNRWSNQGGEAYHSKIGWAGEPVLAHRQKRASPTMGQKYLAFIFALIVHELHFRREEGIKSAKISVCFRHQSHYAFSTRSVTFLSTDQCDVHRGSSALLEWQTEPHQLMLNIFSQVPTIHAD